MSAKGGPNLIRELVVPYDEMVPGVLGQPGISILLMRGLPLRDQALWGPLLELHACAGSTCVTILSPSAPSLQVSCHCRVEQWNSHGPLGADC